LHGRAILALNDDDLANKLDEYRAELRDKTLAG